MGLRDIKKQKLTEPRTILLFSLPKVGKTRAALALPESMTLDFDDSCGYYEGVYLTFKGDNIEERYKDFANKINELHKDVQENGKFKFLVIDTITEFDSQLANAIAVNLYNKDPQTKQNLPLGYNIENLAYGAGYAYKRQAVVNFVQQMLKYAERVIIYGHVGDKSVNKDTKTLEIADVDLQGKLKNIMALKVDAIGLMYREKNKVFINFNNSSATTAGMRGFKPPKEPVLLSELDENDNLTTHWDKIYPDTLKQLSNK